MFRTDDIHETGLARPHLLKFAPNLLGPWAEKLFVWPIALGLMGRNILQSLKETWPDKVLNFLVTFYKNLFQNLKDAACLIQFSFFAKYESPMKRTAAYIFGSAWCARE